MELGVVIGLSAVAAVFWLSLFARYSITHPALLWLPFADVAGVGMTLYLDMDMVASFRDLDRLEELKYSFNKP